MSDDVRKIIYDTLNLRETEELLQIWQTNDHFENEDLAFEIIAQILEERTGSLPAQNEPVYEHQETADPKEFEIFPRIDISKYLDPANAPEFYKPRDVLWLAKKLKLASFAIIGIVILQNLYSLFNSQLINTFLSLINKPTSISNWQLVIPETILYLVSIFSAIILTCIINYLPLKALGDILNILVEMEFRSRGVE